ncbi:hypothetical protein [Mesorhizobium sp.]|uniref:hypothetical protein n=1 Tax=Mesorhizobium sp. TaxID=1871066 RepID=UPI0012186043|nr:hypothetical protein [Mesorhizobium sp.]TIQ46728.1 MAG: hypothetical protein E5X47_23325 [Mesorhizobium sp.]TIQ56501.1 MAG: hypothetical protein E5X46_18690 [Mesorhizobium sp.]
MTTTTLQQAAAALMEAMEDEATRARRKDQALFDALAPSDGASASNNSKGQQQEGPAPTPEDRSEGAVR